MLLIRLGKGELTGEEGFRTTILGKSAVVLQWGNQRLLTKEAGTSAHIDAMRSGKQQKYDDDYVGFVELYDLFMDWNSKTSEEVLTIERPSTQRSSSWFGRFWQQDPSRSGSTEIEDPSLQPRKGSKSSRSSRKASR